MHLDALGDPEFTCDLVFVPEHTIPIMSTNPMCIMRCTLASGGGQYRFALIS
jgi:hypothetical protein